MYTIRNSNSADPKIVYVQTEKVSLRVEIHWFELLNKKNAKHICIDYICIGLKWHDWQTEALSKL